MRDVIEVAWQTITYVNAIFSSDFQILLTSLENVYGFLIKDVLYNRALCKL